MADYDVTLAGSAFRITFDGYNFSSVKIDSTHALAVWSDVGSDGFAQVLERDPSDESITKL
jgi:hypothetical protein